MPRSATRMRLSPSKWKGLVTTPTVSTPSSRTARAITGAAPVPVPPPIPAVMNTMCAPDRCSRISGKDSSAAPRPISGFAPAPSPSVSFEPNWIFCSAFDWCSACASVLATTKLTPSSLALIMLLTALPPAPPTPRTVMRGLSSCTSGALKLMVMSMPPRIDSRLANSPKKSLVEPTHQTAPLPLRLRRGVRIVGFRRTRRAGNKKPQGCCVSRPCGCRGQTGKCLRPSDADLLVQNLRRHFAHSAELRATPGQHRPSSGDDIEAALLQPRLHFAENFFQPRLDDARHHGTAHAVAAPVALLAHQRHFYEVSAAVHCAKGGAIERFDALCRRKRRRQHLGDIGRDMGAPQRHRIDMDERIFHENCNRQ